MKGIKPALFTPGTDSFSLVRKAQNNKLSSSEISKMPLEKREAILSSEAKKLAKAQKDLSNVNQIETPDVSTPDIPNPPESPDLPDLTDKMEKVKERINSSKEAGKKIKKASETAKIKKKLEGSVKKPGIFIFGGLKLFSVDSVGGSYSGMKDISEYAQDAEFFDWDQQEEVINEVMKRAKDQPIILIGHSFGADSAVEVAQELNTLSRGFRDVDLLFTLDSVGFDNDLIPSNVKKNINYFSQSNMWLNDSANWPENEDKTVVENKLVKIDHMDLDDDLDIQAHILDAIDSTLENFKS